MELVYQRFDTEKLNLIEYKIKKADSKWIHFLLFRILRIWIFKFHLRFYPQLKVVTSYQDLLDSNQDILANTLELRLTAQF